MTTDDPGQPGAGPAGPETGVGEPNDEELQAALEEQMRRITVPDVLMQTVVTLVNLGARRLGLTTGPEEEGGAPGASERDLGQARLAIEATRALVPLLPGDVGPIREALSQLQIAYARETQAGAEAPGETAEAAGAPGGDAPAGGAGQAAPPSQAPAPDPEREKARSKIWTPPGS